MKIAVTGGCGFIGSNFINYICRKHPEYNVINLDKMTYAANPVTLQMLRKYKNHSFVKIDIAEAMEIEQILENCEVIVHFAAETHVDRSLQNAENFLTTDIIGTYRIIEAIRKIKTVKKYIHISTDEVYGSIEKGSFAEDARLNPTNPYAATKASADLLVLSYIRCYKIPAVIVRFVNNFGPFQHPEKFIPLAITNAIENKKIPLYGNGFQMRDWLFVEDTCRAIELLIDRGETGEIYHVSAHQEKRNIDVLKKILALLGKDEKLIVSVPDRIAHDVRYSLSCEKIEKLGFQPARNFDDGLVRTVKWYKENQYWWTFIKNSDEFQKYYKNKYPSL